MDDYTARLESFVLSTFEGEQGVAIRGGFPQSNAVLKQLNKLIPFRYENGLLEFELLAENLHNFELSVFLLKNKEFDHWALQDNRLFFSCEAGHVEGGMSTVLMMAIDDKKEYFKGVMRLSLTQFALEAYLDKPWEQAFGLEQFSVLEAGVDLGVTFEPMFSFALQGHAKLVETELAFGVAFNPTSIKENVFSAELKELDFSSLVKGIKNRPIPSPLNKFTDNFIVHRGFLQIAPMKGVTLFEKHYEGGVNAELAMVFFALDFEGKLTVKLDQFELLGQLAPVSNPHFALKSYEDAQKGPKLQIQIQKDRFEVEMNGEMRVYGLDIGIIGHIGENGLELKAKESVSLLHDEAF